MKLIVASIPLFFILIGIEILAARLLERRVYSFADSFADLGCGMIEQLLGVLVKAALFAAYLGLYANARLFNLKEDSWVVYAICFLAVDFFYYWFHRTSHEVGAFSVHHQSEQYNLSVALRQGAFQSFFSWAFYLPLAVFGFPPLVFLTCSALNTLYQFWIHTRLIGKLGPLEWVLNTPSHHRVHHGRNPRYIDRNHAGALIIWDRMFGTFVEETDEPVYGIVKPLRSVNPLWANFAGWKELLGVSTRARRWVDRIRPFVSRPGWRPAELGGPVAPPEVRRSTDEPTGPETTPAVSMYVFAHFVLLLGLTATALVKVATLSTPAFTAVALLVVISLVVLSGLLEGRPWARPLEIARLLSLLVLAGLWGPALIARLFGNA